MKKIKLLSAIITASIAFSSLSIPALSANAASNGCEMGDVNGDGNISIDDVTDIQKYLANIIDFTDEQVALSDVDKNGSVSIDDVTYIQKQIADISESENPTEPTEPVFPDDDDGKTWHDAVYVYIEHPAETEQVWVVDKESYTVEDGVYEHHSICKGCIDKASEIVGYRIWDIEETDPRWYEALLKANINPFLDEMSEEDGIIHSKSHLLADENAGWYTATVRVVTQTITVPEEGHWETKVIKEAWTEKVLVRDEGYY